MATVNLDQDSFRSTIRDNDIVLIDFWAEWCGPCRMFGPVYENVSADHQDIVFAKVDTEAEQGLAQSFQITSIPTLLAVRDSVVLYSQPGALPETQLRQLVEQVRGIDMDQVRSDIASQEASSGTV